MASNSAGNVLRDILGRIEDLSAAIEQNGSSLSSARASQSTTSVENEVRNVFGALHQAPSSTASASSPAVSASQNGPHVNLRSCSLDFEAVSKDIQGDFQACLSTLPGLAN